MGSIESIAYIAKSNSTGARRKIPATFGIFMEPLIRYCISRPHYCMHRGLAYAISNYKKTILYRTFFPSWGFYVLYISFISVSDYSEIRQEMSRGISGNT